MVIAVDFDGTIVEHRYPEIGREFSDAIDTLKFLQQLGHKIIIWTCRGEESIIPVKIWFKERDFIPDAINRNIDTIYNGPPKIYADIYVDDRSFPPFRQEWRDLINMVLSRSK